MRGDRGSSAANSQVLRSKDLGPQILNGFLAITLWLHLIEIRKDVAIWACGPAGWRARIKTSIRLVSWPSVECNASTSSYQWESSFSACHEEAYIRLRKITLGTYSERVLPWWVHGFWTYDPVTSIVISVFSFQLFGWAESVRKISYFWFRLVGLRWDEVLCERCVCGES